MVDGGVCIYLDWIVGGPVNVICIGHSSDRMVALSLPPCQQPCYPHACVKILGQDEDKDKEKDKDKDKDKNKKNTNTNTKGIENGF